jgi:hypothetical protein
VNTKRIILLIVMIILVGNTCTMLPNTAPNPAPVQQIEPTPFTLEDALTLAHQTIDAEIPVTGLEVLGKHHVAEGETLTCIGRGYKVLPEAIASFNQIDPASDLEIGQVLEIPAIIWTNIPPGPACLKQFDVSEWLAYVDKVSQSSDIPTQTITATKTKGSVSPTQTVTTTKTYIYIAPTKTLLKIDKPKATECPPNIQMPCGGATMPPIQCCDTCLAVCTKEPPPPPPPPPPEPIATLIPITLVPIDPFPCFPPPCPPTFSLP